MNFELSSTKPLGLPFKRKKLPESEEYDYIIQTGVFTKVSGQPYKGFENFDKIEVVILETDSSIEIKEKMDAAGAEYIAIKYPNT